MTIAALGDVVTIKGGGTPSKSRSEFWNGDIPWVSPKDMKKWEIYDADDKITETAIRESATNLIPANSILVVNRSGILKHTLPVGLTRRPVAINQDIKALICSSVSHPEYIAHILKAAEPIVLKWVRATTADNFPVDNLRELKIPLPSLDEQRRIAAILDKADALRRKRKRALELLDGLTQSIFMEMFGGLLEHQAKGGAEMQLREIFDFKNGINFTSEERGSGFPVIDVLNMYTDSIFASNNDLYRVNKKVKDDVFLRKNDLLFVKSSVKREGVGWAALFPGASEPVSYCGFIIRARPKRGLTNMLPRYMVHYLRLPHIREKLIASAGQVAITNINQERLGALSIPIADAGKQEQFENFARYVERLNAKCKAQLNASQMFFSSLQQRAFSGRL